MPVDEQRLRLAMEELNRFISVDAGGVEIVSISKGGSVDIRFTGMCVACHLRPLTMAATVRPALLAVPGITDVQAQGSRISVEAENRLAAAMGRPPMGERPTLHFRNLPSAG